MTSISAASPRAAAPIGAPRTTAPASAPRSRPAIRRLRRDVDESPFLVIWEVTRACDLVCAHCRADAARERHPLELTLDEGRRLLDEVASMGPPRPLVVLSGGDPFEREDLADLVSYGTSVGLAVALSPSVTPRLTRSSLARMRDAGAKALSLSLDGATPATHDGFRGVDGVFDATLEAAAWARELGYRLQLNTTVTAGNVDELPDVLAQVLQLDAFLWSVFFLVGTGRGELLQALDGPTVEDVLHLLYEASRSLPIKSTEAPHYRRVVLQREAAGEVADVAAAFGLGDTYRRLQPRMAAASADTPQRRTRPPLDINAGRGFVFVDHIGAVYPSSFLPLPAGTVREQSLGAIYRDAPMFRALRDPDRFGGRCGRCDYRTVCGGSRSRAYAATGDPLGPEPTCVYEPAGGGAAVVPG